MLKKWSIEEIIHDLTGYKVRSIEYNDCETCIATLEDDRIYYANNAWTGFVPGPIDELIAELQVNSVIA